MEVRLGFLGRLILPALFAFFIFSLVGCLEKPPSEVANVTEQTQPPSSIVSKGTFSYQCAISENVTCTGSLSSDGTITLNIFDRNGPQRSVRIRGPIDAMYMCRLNGTELDEVKKLAGLLTDKSTGKLTDANRIRNYCLDRSTYHSYCGVESNPASNPVLLRCGNASIATQDDLNYLSEGTKYHMYVLDFAYGERMEVYDSYGEFNKTAYQKFLSDKSCKQDGEYYYDCAVDGTFIAIPK